MPFTVVELDRSYARRICLAAWQAQLIQASERMMAGGELVMYAPDYRAENDVALIVAEIRHMEQARRVTP